MAEPTKPPMTEKEREKRNETVRSTYQRNRRTPGSFVPKEVRRERDRNRPSD